MFAHTALFLTEFRVNALIIDRGCTALRRDVVLLSVEFLPDLMKQFTIQKPVSVQGVGLHTGKTVMLTFKPATVNHGYRFQRVDLPDQPVIPAAEDFFQ